ncbi:MAG: hypothetical protein ACRDTC_21590 [Pseudonocardiaceae bacterium]
MELPLIGHYFLLGPLVALLVVGLLAGLLRWTYGTSRQHVAPPTEVGAHDSGDFGLLRQVAVVPSAEAAEVLRILAADGIRATVGPTADNLSRRVLVFDEDEPIAKLVLSRPD